MIFLDNCRRLVGLDSTPSHGNLAAAEFAGALCTEAGLHVEYQREFFEGVEQCNVIARPAPGMPREEILFQTHLDTADPGHFGHWHKTQANPFNASIYNDDAMYGLGTADCKLDFLCKLEALKALAGRSLRTPFVLVGTFGAQSGLAGAIKLIRRKKLNARRALIGAPTQMRLVTAGLGLAVVEIAIAFSDEERAYRREHDLKESSSSQSKMFSGRSEGDNAIMKMLAYLAQLPEGIAVMNLDGGVNHNTLPASAMLEVDIVAAFQNPILPKISKIFVGLQALENDLRAFPAAGFEPPYPTVNLGLIRTSETEVRITGTCRLPPSLPDSAYEVWIKKLEQAVQAAGATFCVKGYLKGFDAGADSDFVHALQEELGEMRLSPGLHKVSGVTEANVMNRSGIECVVWGPGQSVGNSHGPNECIRLSELQTAVDFYRRVGERFCL